jgi:hypothetical protein
VEYYGHVQVKGLGKLLAPQFKAAWRDIKYGAREGLARVRGRPAERSETAAAPRVAAGGAKARAGAEVETIGEGMAAVPARAVRVQE